MKLFAISLPSCIDVLFLGILFSWNGLNGALGAETLQSYNVDTSNITVSGLSSGGAMAMQFHVAFSSEIEGSAIFAGVPFACAKGGLTAANLCMYGPTSIVVANLAKEIRDLESANKIDDSSNLSGSKVFVFHGTRDTTVNPVAGQKLEQLYREFDASIETEYSLAAAHGYPTNFYGGACGTASSATHFINNCNYHGAFISLNYLLGGSLTPPSASVEQSKHFAGQLIEFDQREFGGNALSSMDPVGYIYVPSGCHDRSKSCKLHIAFHGCQQSKTNLGDIYATKTGYLEVAEANDIIVLFPQAAPNILQGNPNACWDWWGYLNLNFLNKAGAQMNAVHRMMQRVATCEPSTGCDPSVTTTTTTAEPSTVQPSTPGEGSTTKAPPNECRDNDVSFHPSPGGDCRYYIACACGTNILLECAPGLYFDPAISKCNFMQLVPECDQISFV